METHEQIFIRVVEAGSLKAAAKQLNTDPSSVSRKIAALENRLGVKLLNRSTSRSSPTEVGENYYHGLRKLVDEELALEAAISGESEVPRGTLRITAPVDFGSRFVVPVLQKMHEDFPQLSIELLLGSHYEDVRAQGIDVAIRIGRLPDSSLICRKLGEVPRALVASPHYLKTKGVPRVPADLERHHFIFYSQKQKRSPIEFTYEGNQLLVQVNGGFTLNSVTAIKELVLNGSGIHFGPLWAFKEEISNGTLNIVLPEYRLQAFPLHALYNATAYVPAKVRKFIDLMVEQQFKFG